MRTDSNAHTYLRREPIGRRLRVPAGAQVKQIPIERGPNGETGTRGDYVVASAQVLAKKQIGRTPATTKRAPVEPWQTEAWELRDETGELRFIGDRQARSCSQVRLYVGKKETPTGDVMPIDDGIGAALGHALFANLGQTEQTLKRAAQHLIYNGESLQVIREDPDTGALTWDAHSVSELTGTPGRWKLNNGVDPARDLGDDEILIRTWTAHPQWGGRADAPVRAILPIARELRAMSQYISAQMDSRLAGAGVLLIPDDLQSMHSQGGDDDDDYSLADELTDYMVTPIKDRDSAASIVPIMLTGNGDSLDKVRHISFATELDQQVPDLRDESIRRVGLGMDSDPSVLLGQGSSNHWSAWAVDENEIKFAVQPIVAVVCHALTVGLLRPLLVEQGVPDPDLYSIWYDATPLLVRPDRSKDAQALYDKDVIGAAVLRRENGFDDEDAPTDVEQDRKLLLALLQSRPDWADKLLPALGLVVPGIGGAPEEADEAAADTETAPGAELASPDSAVVAPEPDNGPPVPGETEASR